MTAIVSVERLSKRYGDVVAVDGLSFDVAEGEIFGLIGPNGAGKTTAVECVQGLRRADGGTIRVLGLDPARNAAELRRLVGCQLQEAALPDRLRVGEALTLFASFARDAADWPSLLRQWGLWEHRNVAFGSLSGGQRQRLFVTLALVNRPRLVFLDEVTQGLDPVARRTAWKVIRSVREHGATVVLVTHYMDEAEELCDRVAIVDRGRVVALGSPARLVDDLNAAVRVRFTLDGDVEWLRALADVTSVDRNGREVVVDGSGAVLAHVAAALVERGHAPTDLRVERPTLEDVFLALTGRVVES